MRKTMMVGTPLLGAFIRKRRKKFMATLNLNGQQAEADAIAPHILRLKQLMGERKDLWQKITLKKRKKWVEQANDPVMDLAYQAYEYLIDKFFNDKYWE